MDSPFRAGAELDREFARTQQVFGWCLLSVVAVACIGVNVTLPAMAIYIDRSAAPVASWLLGACVAQGNLISIWGVMATGRLLLRLPWSVALLTIMWYSLVIGFYFTNERFRLGEAVQLGLILLLSLPFAMAPLGLLSWLFGWKLDRQQGGAAKEQMSIRLLLAGTLLVACLLALGKLILPEGPLRLTNLEPEFWVFLPAIVAFNLLLTTPAIWAVFLPHKLLAPCAALMTAYVIAISAMEIVVVSYFLGPPPNLYMTVVNCVSVNLAQVVTIVTVLGGLRLVGFRLHQKTVSGGDILGDPSRNTASIEELWANM